MNHAETPHSRSEAGRAPLLYLIVPAVAAAALAKSYPADRPLVFALAAVSVAGLAVILDALGRRKPRRASWSLHLWHILFPVGAFLLCYAYASMRMPAPHAELAALPPRWADVTLKVQSVYPENAYGNVRGIARVEKAPAIQNHLVGERLFFSVKGPLDIPPGSEVEVKGIVKRLPESENTDSFHAWLERSGVYFELRRGKALGPVAPPGKIAAFATSARDWMREKLLEGSDKMPEIRALVPAMMLGDKALMSPEDKTVFRETGMMHLFAVSGLHVGLVALVVEGLLALGRLGRTKRIPAAQVILLLYVVAIGAPPSAVRAFLMILFMRAAALVGRPAKGLPSLAASALAVLVWQPMQLFDIGAQLSYAIVAAILLYGLPLAELLKEKLPLYPDFPPQSLSARQRLTINTRDSLATSLGMSLAAFAVSVPLSVAYFGYLAPGSVLLNILMIPIALLAASAAVVSSTAALVAAVPVLGFFAFVKHFVNHAAWLAAWEMEGIAAAAHKIPFFHFEASFAAGWQGPAMTALVLFIMVVLASDKLHRRLLWMLAPPAVVAIAVALSGVIGRFA
ncbi:MAG TPA: ComEC/Rec2 family competence protein [Opitutales bacterium]|nr:ComEC/Rec2 family competence protein [Opitutales bacterium]